MQSPECGHNERIVTVIWMLDISLRQILKKKLKLIKPMNKSRVMSSKQISENYKLSKYVPK